MRKVLIIAEAGVNHNGDLNKAKELINVAASAGADYVKFQSFKAEKLVSPNARKADYQIQNFDDGDSNQFNMLKKLELSDSDHHELMEHCAFQRIAFLSTAFDVDGLDYLASLGLEIFKVPSGEITNFPYLRKLAQIGKPVILSTGMASLKEIEDALEVLKRGLDLKDITVLHCNTEYPTPFGDVNLFAMLHIKNSCGVEVGYSDHTLGIEVPIAAVALGGRVIEKHFTLDRNLPGPDHAASLEPEELKEMVSCIRNIEDALSGDGIKVPSPSEIKNKEIVRKSVHLLHDLLEGQELKESDLISLRPGNGISPMEWDQVLGRKLNKSMSAMSQLQWSDLA
jgi:N,N'-diacetyllegionaminate synthase